tara:strand:+ start:102 stop:1103 length:1002 start_codon:yes stop_codon:yes gene_type:complete
MNIFDTNHSIYVAGSSGMVGSAICKLLINNGYKNNNYKKKLLTTTRNELDLRDNSQLELWFKKQKPDIVIIAAAKVGGIMANQRKPVDFLLDNLKIQNNIIEQSFNFGVKRLLFLGSSCIYPKFCKQPIKENYLLNDILEGTNEFYALAKIAGLKLCEAYRKQYGFDAITLMPTNLYGPNDNYDLNDSHVMAALIRKIYEAKKFNKKNIICWGTGKPLREFLFVNDLAEACFFTLKNWFPCSNNSPLDHDGNPLCWLNVGSEYEISIFDLAKKIANFIEYKGEIIWDSNMPDGTPRKKLDTNYINKLGWVAKTCLDDGIKETIKTFEKELFFN